MASTSVFVLATVLSVQGKFAYPCCTRCRKRIRTLEQEQKFSCSSCKQYYQGDEVHYRFRINLVASDRSQVANVTVFGSCFDVFFGASATEFMRFVGRLQSNLDIGTNEASRLVHQAMQQCFVGSMLKFGFRLSPPYRTGSQIFHSSPVNLGNVASKQRMQKHSHQAKLEGNQHNMPSLLANLLVPCVSTECQTVLGIFQGYLAERLHTTVNSTPCFLNVKSVHAVDVHKDPDRQVSHGVWSSQNCGGVSAIHYSGVTGHSMLSSPLVLTCDLEADNCSTPCTKGQCSPESAVDHGFRNTDVPMTPSNEKDCLADFFPLYLSSQDLRDFTNTCRHSQPRGASKPSSAPLTTHEPCSEYPDCRDTDASQQSLEIKWSQLEDLPSSEDLSAFLADLALDGDEEGQVVVADEQCSSDCQNKRKSLNEQNSAWDSHDQCENLDKPCVAVDRLQKYSELTDLGQGDLTDAEEGLTAVINDEGAASSIYDEMESSNQPVEAAGKLHNLTDLVTDLSLDGVFTGDEGLVPIINGEDSTSGFHVEMKTFSQPIEAVGKLHNLTGLTDLSLDGVFTGDHEEGLVAASKEEVFSDSSGCHAEMRSCNCPEPQKDLALDVDLADDEGHDAIPTQQATLACCQDEMKGFNKSIETMNKLQNFSELEDLPSSEDLEAFLADMDEDCFVEENDGCAAFHSVTKAIQTSAVMLNFSNSLKCSTAEKTSFLNNEPGKNELHSEISTAVEDASENVSLCRPFHEKDTFESDDNAKAGHDAVNFCSSARRLPKESHQESTPNSCSTPSVSSDTPSRVAVDTNKVCRATKRVQESKLTPKDLRVTLLRKLTWSSRGYSVSSPTLSPQKKIKRKGQECRDRVCETPEQGRIHFAAYSEELFASASSATDSCAHNESSVRFTEFACGENAEPRVLESSSVCSLSGQYGGMRCCVLEADQSVTDEKGNCDLCSVSSKSSLKSDSPSYFGSPELFSPSPVIHQGSPALFSPERSDHCFSSCEASGSVLLFSSHDSYLSSCGSQNFSNIENKPSSHSTPVLKVRREEEAGYGPLTLPCSKVVTPHGWDISEAALTESPLLFSQLSNNSLVNSP